MSTPTTTKSLPCHAIRTDKNTVADGSLAFNSMYAVNIAGTWYEVHQKMEYLQDPATRCDDKKHPDWAKQFDHFGAQYTFEMVPIEDPHKELPDELSQFLQKHLSDGSTTGCLIIHRGEATPPASAKKGWVTQGYTRYHQY